MMAQKRRPKNVVISQLIIIIIIIAGFETFSTLSDTYTPLLPIFLSDT
jgi:hypothetical protein